MKKLKAKQLQSAQPNALHVNSHVHRVIAPE
jgi:hypothetical protein